MPFLNKCVRTAPQVLSLEDCPPDNVPHLPSEYPNYYNALYHPDLHPCVFESPQLFCEWLTASIQDHVQGLHSCYCQSFACEFSVD